MNKVNSLAGGEDDKLTRDIFAILDTGQHVPWSGLAHVSRKTVVLISASIGVGALALGAVQSSGFVASVVAPLRRAIAPDHSAGQIILRPYRPPSSVEVPITEAAASDGQFAPADVAPFGQHAAAELVSTADREADRSSRHHVRVKKRAPPAGARHVRHRARFALDAADDVSSAPPIHFGRKHRNIKLVEQDARLDANDAIAALRGR